MTYTPPLDDIRFTLHHVVGLADVLPEGVEPTDIDAALDEAGKFAANVLAPLNVVGDRHPAKLENGIVRTADGHAEAYRAFVDAGWNSVAADPDHGGQGLGMLVASACSELWSASNMSFGLCPMLTMGAIECLENHGSADQKAKYLPKMIEGTWTGTMNLTEPQAGSDLAAVRTKAERRGDHYALSGQKIFITYGDHEWTDNIVHLVLARLPDAPPGVKGISLFLAPKFLINEDGSRGRRNDLRAVSLEHKMGIHSSPTAVMAFGDNGECYAELVGEENRGLEYMFTMMNNARLNVGVQGMAIAERAYQQARDYARTRVQGKPVGWAGGAVPPIAFHPDVRRMLAVSRAKIEAARALSYEAAAMIDRAHRGVEGAQARVDLLIPIVKAWCTEIGCEVASTGVQIHGGMGFIEETGAAQHYRDARIAPIYEGTNGIQANDLTGRKVLRDGGKGMTALLADIAAVIADAEAAGGEAGALAPALATGHAALTRATQWLLDNAATPVKVAAISFPYLELAGAVTGGWMMTRAALAAQAGKGDNPGFAKAKLVTARIFADHVLSRADGLDTAIRTGADSLLAIDADLL